MLRARATSHARLLRAPDRFEWFPRQRSFEFLFRVHPNEHHIDKQIKDDDEAYIEEHRAQHHCIITIKCCVYEIASESRNLENCFYGKRSGDQRGGRWTSIIHDWHQSAAQRVLQNHA